MNKIPQSLPCFAVLASGSGTNFGALAEHFPKQLAGLVCNVAGAGVLERARLKNISAAVVPHVEFANRGLHERAIVGELFRIAQISKVVQPPQTQPTLKAPPQKLSLVVLAGYMRVLTPTFFEQMQAQLPGVRVINLHPAHLSDYKGAKAYAAAVERRAPRWGLSVHEVVPELDSGPLLGSTEIPVPPFLNPEELQRFAQPFEHKFLCRIVAGLLHTE